MSEAEQGRTELPTVQRVRDARSRGVVARSQDLASAIVLLAGAGAVWFFSWRLCSELERLAVSVFGGLAAPIESGSLLGLLSERIGSVLLLLLPLLLTLFGIAVFANVCQVGFLFTWETLQPRWQRINPFHGANYRKFVDSAAWMRLVFSLLKAVVALSVSFVLMRGLIPEAFLLSRMPLGETLYFVGSNAMWLGVAIGAGALSVGVLDWLFQRWQLMQHMKMSRHEVVEERKQSEGDPQVRSHVKDRAEELSATRVRAALVPNVLVLDEEGVAVSLCYRSGAMDAPVCVAKGSSGRAEAMRRYATNRGMLIVKDAALALVLSASVEPGDTIPSDLYHRVALAMAKAAQDGEVA